MFSHDARNIQIQAWSRRRSDSFTVIRQAAPLRTRGPIALLEVENVDLS